MDQLFARYRDAIPELEPSPEFLRNVWRRIEENRGVVWTSLLQRWAPRVAAVSALATVLLAASVWIPEPRTHEDAVLDHGYIDALTVGSLDEHDGALWMMAGDRLATRR